MTDQLDPTALAALRDRFKRQSDTAQVYYAVMHAVRPAVGSDEAASAWMTTALPAIGGQTPADAVAAGRHEDVLAYIRTL
jgi:hypothetical protein